MSEFPWSVFTLLSCGLAFTAYIIYYILKLAHEEMNDETSKSDFINHKSEH
jgi:hypothetical protein